MASVSHDHAQAHDDSGAVHAHVSSSTFYGLIFMALVALTVLTVGQSYVDLGKANLVVVIIIASMKASLVVSFFMHLRWDNKFNALIFISCLLFIGVFFAYTMNDTERRGELDPDQNVKRWSKNGELAPGGLPDHAASAGSAASAVPGVSPSGTPAKEQHGH